MPDVLERITTALADRYRIERELGRGGMATVYLAHDIKQDRQVAVKVLQPELAAVIGAERFLNEIKVTANLQHPNILPLFDSGEADGFLYYVMPYVEGESLRALLDRKKQLPIERALEITKVVASALGHAHRHGVIHRDIKPENILLADDGQPLVADFGIALAVNEAGGARLTETGMSLGTPEYMSPEQATGDRQLEPASDIYSLGAVLYEMLVGDPPHMGNTAQAIIARIMIEKPASISTVRDTVPHAVEAAIMKALAKVPADRPLTAERFVELLEAPVPPVKEPRGPTSTRPIAAAPPPVSPTVRLQSRRNLIAYATVATLAIIGGYAVISRIGSSPALAVAAELPRLAVLPFDNLGSAEDEYFADGITEEITSRIAEISGLLVISRTSAMQYKNHEKTLRQISQELSVGYVLEGTVRTDRSPDGSGQVRVTPQLIRVSDDAHLWTNRYTASLVPGEIFRVQEQIAEQVAQALDVTLLEPERRRLAATPTDNQEAYQYYMRGNDYFGRNWGDQDRRIAIQMYQKAVELDPNFALAYAGLSQAHSQMWWFLHDRTEERLAMAKEAVDSALSLSPDLPEAHGALGWYHYHGHLDYEPALAEFAIAEESQPNNGNILYGIAAVQRRQGRMQEALTNFIRAAELAPRSATAAVEVALTYTLLRDPVEAGRFYDRAISLSPDLPGTFTWKANWLHLRLEGNTDRARTALERAEGVAIGSPDITFAWIVLHTLDGNYQAALDRLALVSSEVLSGGQLGFKADLYAQIHGLLGNQQLELAYYDSARSVLETEIQQHPDDSRYRSALGIAYAGLGRKDDAIREGELAVELLPMSLDAWMGAFRAEDLARIYAMVGEYDAAVDQLEHLLSVPSPTAVPMLRIDPTWNPLRGHPRFQRLLQQEN